MTQITKINSNLDLVPISLVTETLINRLYQIMCEGYDCVDKDTFNANFARKSFVYIVKDARGIQGFSTLALREIFHNGKKFTLAFSGDTFIRRDARGKSLIINNLKKFLKNLESDHVFYILASMHPRTYFLMSMLLGKPITSNTNSGDHDNPDYSELIGCFVSAYPEYKFRITGENLFMDSEYYVNKHTDEFVGYNVEKKISEYRVVNPNYLRGDEVITFHRIR